MKEKTPNYEQRLQEAFESHKNNKAESKGKKELVMFHGDYAGPSKAHKKVIEDACEHFGLKPRIVNITSEKGMEEALKYKLTGAPSVAVVENGKVIDKYTGGKTHEEVHHFIGKNFGSNATSGSTKKAGVIDWSARLAKLHARRTGKPLGDVTREQLKWTLQKHEDRETPAQEKQESQKEQEIEQRAGIHEKQAFWNGFTKEARELTTKARNNLPDYAFVFPKERRYPIHDESHARNALARASGKPEESKVKAAVHRKYPHIGE